RNGQAALKSFNLINILLCCLGISWGKCCQRSQTCFEALPTRVHHLPSFPRCTQKITARRIGLGPRSPEGSGNRDTRTYSDTKISGAFELLQQRLQQREELRRYGPARKSLGESFYGFVADF